MLALVDIIGMMYWRNIQKVLPFFVSIYSMKSFYVLNKIEDGNI